MTRGLKAAAAAQTSPAGGTRAHIVAAVIATLREEGFAGCSARAIARHGGFNQALIFYHFGSVADLMIAALQHIAQDRLTEYRSALVPVSGVAEAIDVARKHYARDVAAGHITVLAELIAGASSVPSLGPEVVRCMEPWIDFAVETIERLLRGTPLQRLVAPRDAATALVALYVGMEMVDHLDASARVSSRLFRSAVRLAAAAEALGLATSQHSGSRPSQSTVGRPRRIELT